MKQLKDKTALVTGGGSGIGLATARALGARGARLILADIDKARVTLTIMDGRIVYEAK